MTSVELNWRRYTLAEKLVSNGSCGLGQQEQGLSDIRVFGVHDSKAGLMAQDVDYDPLNPVS